VSPHANRSRGRRFLFIGLGVLLGVPALGVGGLALMIRMPGSSFRGRLPEPSDELKSLSAELERHVVKLGLDIGSRSAQTPEKLRQTADYVADVLQRAGTRVERQAFDAGGQTFENLEVTFGGARRPAEIVVLGAHYDTVPTTPGANDNATGVAALLALARAFAGKQPARTLRLVAFANEEPPYFQTDGMGSAVYARGCRQRAERIVAMLSLECMGYYTDADKSQHYPPPLSLFYPSRGDFIAVVGDRSSAALTRQIVGSFRRHAQFPSEGAALPAWLPGVGWSDQWAFWQQGYPAVMLTDTAPFRYPYYHTADDTPDKVDFDRLARVVAGLELVVAELLEAE
jgi:hypothetical protein